MRAKLAGLVEQDYVDKLFALYSEQIEHARHHEVMRAEATNYILVASTALIGFISADKFGSAFGPHARIAAVVVTILLNIYGMLLSAKHYERNRLHARVAGKYRTEISDRFAHAGFTAPNALRKAGRDEAQRRHPFLYEIRLNWLWIALHMLFIVIAVVLTQI